MENVITKETDDKMRNNPNRFKVGDQVVYIPHHLLMGDKTKMVKDENLGEVTSINHTYVFVRYWDNAGSKATYPRDLFWIKNRQDLIDKLQSVTQLPAKGD